MRLVENYLNQARQLLPKDLREDVIAELRATLEEQVLDHATAENRQPSIADEKAVLSEFGHPMKIAGAYLSQQYLIGPPLFPAYLHALKIIPIVVLVINLVMFLAVSGFESNGDLSFFGLFWHLLDTAITVVVIVTLVFAAIEYSGERLNWYENWHPDALDHGPSTPVDREDLLINIIVEGVLLLWWNEVLTFSNWLEIAPTSVAMSEAWSAIYWPLNVVLGSFFLLHAYLAARGDWHQKTLALECFLDVAFIGLAIILLTSGSLVEVDATVSVDVQSEINRGVMIVVIFFIAVTAWELYKYGRLFSRLRTEWNDERRVSTYSR